MKMMNCLMIVALLLVATVGQISGAVVVANYGFDDPGNLVNDDSGNGKDLAVYSGYGTPTYDSSGKVGGASRFDGSTQGWVTPTNIFPAGSFSFSVWVKQEVTTNASIVAIPWSLTSGFEIPSSVDFRFFALSANGLDYTRSYVAPSGEWQHVAMTYEATSAPVGGIYTGTLKGYVDGTLRSTLEGAEYQAVSWNVLALGRRSTAVFNGLMDEVSIYSGALTDGEVLELSQIPEPATVALFTMGSLFMTLRKKMRK